MPCLSCVACNTRLHGIEGAGDLIGDLCSVWGALWEPAGDLGELARCRVETRGSVLPSGASGAGQLIAGRVGEIISRRELLHPSRVRFGIERCDAALSARERKALVLALPAHGDEVVRRRRGALTTAAPPRLPRILGASDAGRRRRERRRQRKVRTPSWSAGHAATWACLSGAG